ncbi:long-chain fatty acid--CoA ligase [Halorubellus litoreus]|uniref:Long-chain fatty acid--CoA ligase n=1 Tax=Halorubellus litoreus TaxID=755308 RepID=A0ABD5V9Q5_9EURY
MDWQEAERAHDGEHVRMETLAEMFERSAGRNLSDPAQKYKGGVYERSLANTDAVDAAPDGEYATLTYEEMREIVRSLAAGFRALGLEPGQRVGMFADTRMEWAQCDLALLAAGGVVTTVYKSSSPEQVRYLLSDSGASGVVVENAELLDRVLQVADVLDVRFVVSLDELPAEYDDQDGVYELADVYEQGRQRFDEAEYQSWLDDRDVEDLASLVYTSGTTGPPKGVQLTHRNFRANINQMVTRYGPRPDKPDSVPQVRPDSVSISFLPLAHVLERHAGHFFMYNLGVCVGFAESPDTLKEDFPKLEPTVANSVPRVYEKLYDGIREQARESALKERIFEWATDVSREVYRTERPGAGLRFKYWLADKLVFQQIKQGLGGNIEALLSGGGTLSDDLNQLYHGMGLNILEAYGLTEAAPAVAANPAEDVKIGTIGPAIVDQEYKIDKSVVPEGEFDDALGQTGELLIRGPNVTEGYWNKPEATESAFTPADDDGDDWFRTGDIVTERPDDYLVFRERAKQLVVLSTGKNVAPAPIEDAFVSSEVVEQCMVVGDQRKFVSALLVIAPEGVREVASRKGVDVPSDPAEMVADETVRGLVQDAVDEVNERFEKHETIKDFRLVAEEFTEDNDLLTPTLKKKRRNIHERYEDLVEDMYADEEARVEA